MPPSSDEPEIGHVADRKSNQQPFGAQADAQRLSHTRQGIYW